MLVCRLATEAYIRDLSGYGAKRFGGRWNREGVAVLYTGGNLSLCAWEYWVHLPETVALKENAYYAATIRLPDNSVETLSDSSLSQYWQTETRALHDLTDDWLTQARYLTMRVPSAIIQGEWNYLVNPAHQKFREVSLEAVVPFSFDSRAFGKSLFL